MHTIPVVPEIIVTRHTGLVEFARSHGLPADVPVVAHASADAVRGRVVLGVLPLHLAAEARAVIEAQLALRPEDRGRELSAAETAERFRGWRVYRVTSLTPESL